MVLRREEMKKAFLLALLSVFTAGPAFSGTINVTQPAGGDITMGAALPIVWTASGVSGKFKIQLIRPGGALVGLLMTNIAASPQSWTVAAPAIAGESYKIRVHAMDGSADGESPQFTVVAIVPVSTLSIVTPQGGESWELGSTQAISWTAGNIQQNCRLVLLKDGQVQGTIRDSFAPGQGGGSWNWKVGDYPGGPAAAAGGYKIRIETVDGQGSAQSANSFAITPVATTPQSRVVHDFPGLSHKFDPRVLEPKQLPDLAVCVARPAPYKSSVLETVSIFVRVKNIGSGSSSPAIFDLYVDEQDTRSVQVPTLAGNQEFDQIFKYYWMSMGEKNVRVIIDPTNQVTENEENNNEISVVVNVVGMYADPIPDLGKCCRCSYPVGSIWPLPPPK
jgi:hypothetical protein